MSNVLENVGKSIQEVIQVPIDVTSSITKPILQPIVQPIRQSFFGGPYDWKAEAFLWIALIIFLILFIWAWVTYDPDQRIFTLYNIPQNQTYNFPRFSGQIIIQDGDGKGVTEWLVGGEEVKLVDCSTGCSDLEDPSSGLLTYNSAINGYTWTQTKYSDPTTYTFITNRIAKSA